MVGRIRGVSTVVGHISVVQAKSVLDDIHRRALKIVTDERRGYVQSGSIGLLNSQQETQGEH